MLNAGISCNDMKLLFTHLMRLVCLKSLTGESDLGKKKKQTMVDWGCSSVDNIACLAHMKPGFQTQCITWLCWCTPMIPEFGR